MAQRPESGNKRSNGHEMDLTELFPRMSVLITLKGPEGGENTFLATIVDQNEGKAVVRPWIGGGQRNSGYRDALASVGSRPLPEGAKPHVEAPLDQEVAWGILRMDEELVIRKEGEDEPIFFTGHAIHSAIVKVNREADHGTAA